jgi:DinB family protein
MADVEALVGRLERATGDLAALRGRVEAGEPWPLSEDFGTSPESSWGPREALAHVAEMLPYWTGEIARVVEGPEPARFGRVATDPLRSGVLERDRTLPLDELFDRIASGSERFGRRIARLSTAQTERRGIHPRLGEMTVAGMAERFVVSHLEEHAAQLKELVDAGRGR